MSGKIPADNYIGRELTRMITQVPKMSSADFDDMLNSNMKVSNLSGQWADDLKIYNQSSIALIWVASMKRRRRGGVIK